MLLKLLLALPWLFHNSVVHDKVLEIHHNAGFFSCCSVKLGDIVSYFNFYKETPAFVDSSDQFNWYKIDPHVDITYDYFKNRDDVIPYLKDVKYRQEDQFKNYKLIDYPSVHPFIEKYFSPSVEIENRIRNLETKYNLDYDNLCVLFYRGNDKITETKLCEYEQIINRAKYVQRTHRDIQFLIQSDETEFIERMSAEFPNSIYFKDEIRHMNKCNSTVDIVFKDLNYEFSKYYLAITVVMSKCKYIICGSSGNCSIWIMLYRNHADGVFQYLNGSWIN